MLGSPRMIRAYVFQCFWAIGRSELTFSNVLGPSDALALRLCSEIAQGQVKLDPHPRQFYCFWALCGNHLKEGYRYLYD